MISENLSNRLVFVFSLFGLLVASYLLYEYSFNGQFICPTGSGCDIVRASSYSKFAGISIPILGVIFYWAMAFLSVVHSHDLPKKLVRKLKFLIAASGVGFGIYLTCLEAFVIKAFCFWCVTSFIISVAILISISLARKENQ